MNEEFDKSAQGSIDKIKNFVRNYFSKTALWIIILVLFALWAGQGIYSIDAPEVGLVKRFGKHVKTVGPGLHYHLPSPIERVIPVDVKSIRKIEVGYTTVSPPPNPRYESNKEEALMLTGDNNIVHIEFAIQFKIQNPENFAFNVINGEALLKEMAEAIMREEIAKKEFTDIITTGRGELAQNVYEDLQKLVKTYDTGMMVENVKLQDANPPEPVVAAFDDVNSAKEDRETYINKAEAYANEVIPQAQGKASQITNKAEAYKQEKVAGAQGDVAKFKNVLSEYQIGSKEITRTRLYIEAMEEILPNTDKIILPKDSSGSSVLKLLNLNEVSKKTENSSSTGGEK